jgi:hypothetical protein
MVAGPEEMVKARLELSGGAREARSGAERAAGPFGPPSESRHRPFDRFRLLGRAAGSCHRAASRPPPAADRPRTRRSACQSARAPQPAAAAALPPDGALLAASSASHQGGPLRVFDAASGAPAIDIDAGAAAQAIAFSPDGKRIALSFGSSRLRVFALPEAGSPAEKGR